MQIGGKDCIELNDGSGIIELGDDVTQHRAMMRLRCEWADAPAIVRAIRGYNEQGPGSSIIVHRPMEYPHDDFSYLSGRNAVIRPSGKPTGASTWTHAIIDAEFGVRAFGFGEDDLWEENLDLAGEIVIVPKENVVIGGNPAVNDARLQIVYGSYSLTFPRMPQKPIATIAAHANRVNSATFRNIPAGHLLSMGATFRLTMSTAGPEYTTIFKMLYDPVHDHRDEFDPATGTWARVKINGQDKYLESDFNSIFEVV